MAHLEECIAERLELVLVREDVVTQLRQPAVDERRQAQNARLQVTMPQRLTVAGDATAKSCTSNIIVMCCTQHTHKPLTCKVYTHTFNGPFSGTTHVSKYQKGKTNLDFTEARDSEWQWHQQGHMQICTSLQTDNHASTSPLSFYGPDALPAAQPTVSKH